MGILWTIVLGFVIGVLAKVLHPGKENMGFIATIVLGIAGSFSRSAAASALTSPPHRRRSPAHAAPDHRRPPARRRSTPPSPTCYSRRVRRLVLLATLLALPACARPTLPPVGGQGGRQRIGQALTISVSVTISTSAGCSSATSSVLANTGGR